MYYCVILIIEKFALKKVLQKIPVFLARIYSLLIVLIGWLIFYYTDLSALITAGTTFFGFSGRFIDHNTVSKLLANLWILPIFAVFSTKLPLKCSERLKARLPITEPIINGILLCISFALLVGQSFNPFLYFRF
jgi:alginate O-acetyltransferase complex protein AlgI